MKRWLREYLGITELWRKLETLNSIALAISHRQADERIAIKHVDARIAVNNMLIARVVAKLDPTYAQDELDPARQEASRELGARIIAKLQGEHAASNKLTGDFE